MPKLLDPRSGFVHFDAIEARLIDSTPLFRLRQIRQLGMAYLFFPGATHTRFEHALGVMQVVTDIYDHLTRSSSILIPKSGSAEHAYWRSVVRAAALLHDVGHLPFSHVAEQLLLSEGHEAMGVSIVRESEIAAILGPMLEDVIKVAFVPSKEAWSTYSFWEKALCLMIVGDCFGADRIDYLLRDSAATGVRYGVFDANHLIQKLVFIENQNGASIGIHEEGLDAISSMLLARHFMYRRVYRHPRVQSIHHFAAFFVEDYFKSNPVYLQVTDSDVLTHMQLILRQPDHPLFSFARSLRYLEERFFAFRMPKSMDKGLFLDEYRRLGIPDNEGVYHLSEETKAKNPLDRIPVCLETGQVVRASALLEWGFPQSGGGWGAVHQKWKTSILELLLKCQKEEMSALFME